MLRIAKMNRFYPSMSTNLAKTSFTVNFGAKPFKFDYNKYAIGEIDKTFQDINQTSVDKKTAIDLIMSYLYIQGNHGTLVSLETTFDIGRKNIIGKLKRCKAGSPTKSCEALSRSTSATTNPSDSDSPDKRDNKPASLLISVTNGFKKLFTKDSTKKSMTMDEKQMLDLSSPKLEESMSSRVELSDETGFLERSAIKKEVIHGRISEAENTFTTVFPFLYQNSLPIQAIFKVLHFLDLFKRDQTQSLIYAKENFSGSLKHELIQYVGINRTIEYIDVKVRF